MSWLLYLVASFLHMHHRPLSHLLTCNNTCFALASRHFDAWFFTRSFSLSFQINPIIRVNVEFFNPGCRALAERKSMLLTHGIHSSRSSKLWLPDGRRRQTKHSCIHWYSVQCLVTLAVVERSYHLSRSGGAVLSAWVLPVWNVESWSVVRCIVRCVAWPHFQDATFQTGQ
jgi:hypothetical protein